MLIVSKFRDYYDTAIAYGIDKECVYNRTTSIPNPSKHKYTNETKYENKNYYFTLSSFIIGFCGNIYRCIKVIQLNKYTGGDIVHGFYDAESLIEYMKEHDIELTNKKFRWNRWSRDNWQSEATIKHYFDRENKQELYDVFRKYHTPIFVKDYNEITINPCLKDFKFGKVKDAFSAFQDIHQYLAGVLGNKEKDTLNISDKVKVKQHGFNNWSFKKLPGQKNRKKHKDKE